MVECIKVKLGEEEPSTAIVQCIELSRSMVKSSRVTWGHVE